MWLTILDLILLLIGFIFISFGFFVGFISMVGSLVALIVGVWVASRYYTAFGQWLSQFMLGRTAIANTIAYILLFGLANRLVGLIFWGINKLYKILSIIPLTKFLNRFLGAILGLIEAVIVMEVALFIALQFNDLPWLTDQLTKSVVAGWLAGMSNIFFPIMPEVINVLKTFFMAL